MIRVMKLGARIVLEAIRRLDVRAPSESIYYADSMPRAWLFSRVSAIVHHGGFGTAAAVLRAGVPEVVIPHVIDQFRLGPASVRAGSLTVVHCSRKTPSQEFIERYFSWRSMRKEYAIRPRNSETRSAPSGTV